MTIEEFVKRLEEGTGYDATYEMHGMRIDDILDILREFVYFTEDDKLYEIIDSIKEMYIDGK